MILILFQDKMRCRTEHRFERGQLIRHKTGDLFQGFSFQSHQQVIAARDQVHGIHFRILVDPLRDLVKTLSALRRPRQRGGNALPNLFR